MADGGDGVGPELVRRALARDVDACRQLVAALTPAVQKRVGFALLRRERAGGGRFTRQEVADLTQEVFLLLWDDDGRVLRSWDPSRGASLSTFVGLVAERAVASRLRSGRRSAWKEDPTLEGDLELRAGGGDHPEHRIADRHFLERLLDRLRGELSPRGLLLFQALYCDQRTPEDVAAEHGMTPDAVYVWRSRMRKVLRQLAAEMAA
jgi:RNA polymerase sigma-70 factor (ECF subfamily)